MKGDPILVVDDNPANLRLAKIVLEVEGYDVRTAIDAKDALSVLSGFHPKLILMDLQMPRMDGLELTGLLKTQDKYKDTIILAVTAYAMKGDEEKALAAGCDGYITKPISTHTLPSTIEFYLSMNT
ncbi:MAG: response regulator [Legionellales bacterium]